MQELINRVMSSLGIDATLAEKAVGIVLNMLKEHGSSDKVNELLSALPGAADLLGKLQNQGGAGVDESTSGGLGDAIGGMLGGGGPLLDTLSEMQSAGLDMTQARAAGLEVINFAKEKAGDDLVKEVAESIPGLSQLL